MGYVYGDRRSGRLIYCVAFNDVDGRWIRRREPGATKARAHKIMEQEEDAVLRAKEKGFPSLDALKAHEAKNAALTFEQFSTDYLDNVRSEVKESTFERYSDIMKRHLVPALGSDPLGSIDPERVEKFRDARLKAGAAELTVSQELSILSGLFTLALKRKKISGHPIRGGMVKKPQSDKRTPRYLTSEEKSALLARVAEPLRSAILISMNTGFRESELASLTWADVDADQRTITISERKSGVPLVVPYNDTVAEVLENLPRYTMSPFVITNPRLKTPTRYDRFNNSAWRKAVRDAGIKSLRWHDLRSHYGSTLAQAGRSSKEIQALLGQSSLASTEKYLALAPENLKAAVRSLDSKNGSGPKVTTQNATQIRVAN
jgi:integrase